ncbi:MAG: hypothetical protein COA93_11530 [Alphaproteobacteria bacterium]|nr:MAG: hypothetical protein COA93_11530 [Alphaproteobacteria bacterium]
MIRRDQFSFDKKVILRVAKYFLASLVMGGIIWIISGSISDMFAGHMLEKISGLFIIILAGIGSYLVMIFITGAVRPKELKALLRGK